MSLEATPREKACGWLLATAIASAAAAIFVAAIVLGDPAASDAAEVRPDGPQFPERELPKEWRWEMKAITFDPCSASTTTDAGAVPAGLPGRDPALPFARASARPDWNVF